MDVQKHNVNTAKMGAQEVLLRCAPLARSARRRRRKKRGRLAYRAMKPFKDLQLLVSKALAPFVRTGEFYVPAESKVNRIFRRNGINLIAAQHSVVEVRSEQC
jgi:hypothetical protein